MTGTRSTALFGAMLLLASVAGCGGSDDNTLGIGDTDLDRCSLITVDEAGQWLGAPVTAAPAEGIDGNPDPVTCLYEGSNAMVLVQVYEGEEFFAEPGSSSRVGEDVEGLGEDAFMDNDSVKFLQDGWAASVSQISGLVATDSLLGMAHLMSSRLP
ncbi:MAG: hypothetical protein WCE80_12625 [Acidimicrobiia bacterium]